MKSDTNRAQLLALADRCEREEPSAALNEAIALAAGWRTVFLHGEPWWSPPGSLEWVMGIDAYTTSLDAAVTLVPEHWDWMVHLYSAIEGHASQYVLAVVGIPGTHAEIMAATPAMALCAAALRARAAQ